VRYAPVAMTRRINEARPAARRRVQVCLLRKHDKRAAAKSPDARINSQPHTAEHRIVESTQTPLHGCHPAGGAWKAYESCNVVLGVPGFRE
jgi:hypothetical protein